MTPAQDDVPENEPDETVEDVSEVRSPRTVPIGVFVLAVLVAGILAVLAIVALVVPDDGDGSSGDSGAATAAGQYAERFLALSYDDYDAWLEDMSEIGTAGFAESIGQNADALRTLLTQAEVSWQGTAVDVFVSESSGDVVSTVVLYDLVVTDPSGTRTIADQYLRVDLVQGSDGWLVERVLSITSDASAVIAGADAPPSTSPSTTAPPATDPPSTTTTAPG